VTADRHLTPAEARARRVALLMDLDDDTDDVSTWHHEDGRPLSAWERRQVGRCTEDEWQQATSLLALDVDVERLLLEHHQRQWIRRAERTR
jgi:hypothetical protein